MEDDKKFSRWTKAVIGEDHYRTELLTDTHNVFADEPVDLGGTDTAPSPGDLLRMSLASCTAITLRMYADRKKIPVSRIEVKVVSETVDGKTLLHTSVHVVGSLDGSQQRRMLQIAKACPVHKMLTNPIEIDTALTHAAQESTTSGA
jgi:putative redox protein